MRKNNESEIIQLAFFHPKAFQNQKNSKQSNRIKNSFKSFQTTFQIFYKFLAFITFLENLRQTVLLRIGQPRRLRGMRGSSL